jgi:hypothetical protein
MRNDEKVDLHFLFLIFITVVFALFYLRFAYGKELRTLRLNNKTVAKIKVSPRGTVLSFPTRPAKVILGSRGMFGLEYVDNDITISSLTHNSRSNMFVYLEGRRFTFDLSTSEIDGDQIVLVRDQFEDQIKVKIK